MKAKLSFISVLVLALALLSIWATGIRESQASAETLKRLVPQILPTAPISGQSVVGLSSSCDQPDRCTISSQSGWFETPLFLQQGANFNVTYLDGAWTVDVNNWPYVGPEGYSPEIDQQIGYESLCKTATSLSYATLLGKVGSSGNIFAVRRGGTFTASSSGYLYLRINDNEICQDNNDGSIRVSFSASAPPLNNDDFDYADTFPEPPPNGLANQLLDTDTNDATVAPDDPDMGCGAGVNSHTLWFKLTPSYYGRVRVRTYSTLDPNASSNYDTVVAVFTGQRGALNRIACNDDTPGHELLSDLAFEAEAGKTYYIEVAAYDNTPGGVLSLFVNYEVEPKAWTLIFYIAANNDLEEALLQQRESLSSAARNLNVNIVALWEGNWNSAYMAFTPWGVEKIPKPDLNTGDQQTLRDFVTWAIQRYPANHYALIISNHGQGFSGTSVDYSSQKDWLTVKETDQALVGIYPKPDIIYMDACLMATLDSAYQLAPHAEYYVASEPIVWAPKRFDYFITGMPAHETEVPAIRSDTSPTELALAMAESYVYQAKFARQGRTPSAISVIKLSEITNVAIAASDLAGLLKDRILTVRSALDGIWWDVQRFESGSLPGISPLDDQAADLYHFASLVFQRITDTDIQGAAWNLMGKIDSALLFNEAWSGYPFGDDNNYWYHGNAHGISVFLPAPLERQCYYNGDWLDFAYGTNWGCQGTTSISGLSDSYTAATAFEWGPMLVEYLNQTSPSAPENWDPPVPVPMLTSYSVYLPLVLRQFGSTPPPTPTPTPPPSAPAIRVEPISGPLGTRFNIYGSGFVPGESVQQWVITPGGGRFDDPTPETVDGQGNYTSWIQIDYSPIGTYTLYAQGNQSQQTVSTQFQITSSSAGGVETVWVSQIAWGR